MEILGFVLLIAFGAVALIAMLAVIRLLFPAPVEKARLKLETSLGKPFLLGLVNLVFFGALGVILLWLGGLIRDTWSGLSALLAVLLGFLALVIAILLSILALNGLVALASLLGERIGAAKSPFWGHARGGLLLLLACLTPYIGWCLFAPFVLSLALGGSLLALFQKRSESGVDEAGE
ncbi:MAG: hypothetical protein FJZ87_08800 [Chloroflexi bacterium]|nr:hypothetical protein [Chloroflexota bacterium]MBM3152387.1 hypothetical protein [Chloroflexota bacterium]